MTRSKVSRLVLFSLSVAEVLMDSIVQSFGYIDQVISEELCDKSWSWRGQELYGCPAEALDGVPPEEAPGCIAWPCCPSSRYGIFGVCRPLTMESFGITVSQDSTSSAYCPQLPEPLSPGVVELAFFRSMLFCMQTNGMLHPQTGDSDGTDVLSKPHNPTVTLNTSLGMPENCSCNGKYDTHNHNASEQFGAYCKEDWCYVNAGSCADATMGIGQYYNETCCLQWSFQACNRVKAPSTSVVGSNITAKVESNVAVASQRNLKGTVKARHLEQSRIDNASQMLINSSRCFQMVRTCPLFKSLGPEAVTFNSSWSNISVLTDFHPHTAQLINSILTSKPGVTTVPPTPGVTKVPPTKVQPTQAPPLAHAKSSTSVAEENITSVAGENSKMPEPKNDRSEVLIIVMILLAGIFLPAAWRWLRADAAGRYSSPNDTSGAHAVSSKEARAPHLQQPGTDGLLEVADDEAE
eukprot:gnl/MRDRNA2_/MRDRNA2_118515_c0_seq1.p1 gnl/MRDRNA2_/MRDRNA2_118515_c0~~gnl/MRDRNA2_/MRDRNA2_118515_c0_seq1.p1  ORF type:complete len:465 (+),score=58.81 gnl/MRDRNA2_/MRDRNA2_118515_c0_seq1:128-1522(+)